MTVIKAVVGAMPTDPKALASARRHVAEGRLIVSRQKLRIARLKAAGCSSLDAEQTLDVFESILRIFEARERKLSGN